MTEFYICHFGLKGIKIRPFSEFPSLAKPSGIQISVCASTWNRPASVIVRSLESIINQGFNPEHYEIILVDDHTEGEHSQDYKRAIEYLITCHPQHNIRAYQTNYTRCWTDSHTLNVAFKRALGKILMISQVDIIHVGETLEAAWRHHSVMNNLWLCPKNYAGDLAHPWPFQYFPHEYGASILKEWVYKIKGRSENIIKEPPDVEFHIHLNRQGIVFSEDPAVQTIHVATHPAPRQGYPERPPVNIESRNPDGTWTTGEWGTLTPEEENGVIMSEAMKKCIPQ